FITGEKWDIGNPEDTSTAVLGIGAMLVGSVITALIAVVADRDTPSLHRLARRAHGGSLTVPPDAKPDAR
ncbi:MAG: hypothetical protein ACKOFF_01890, partial [Acidimicrobiales bacterium]